MSRPTRVLIADDSPTARAVLRRILKSHADLEVVAEATNGAEALAQTRRCAPDVVLMDLEMPVLDGFEATRRIAALGGTPVVILSSTAGAENTAVVFEAMRCGASEVLAKPQDAEGWEALAASLPALLRDLARRPAPAVRPIPARPPRLETLPKRRQLRYLAVGASTGGPNAIRRLLGGMDADRTLAVVVVQHIAAGFEEGFVRWLASETHREVLLAVEGEHAQPGAVYVAPAGTHLRLVAQGVLRLDSSLPPRGGHRPAVDELFFSCAESVAVETVAVLLTGMGVDGAEGLLALAGAGALTLVQDEASSIVFGMPSAALRLGAATVALPPEELGRTIVAWISQESR